MSKLLSIFVVAVVAVTGASSFAGEDDLFSDVNARSVFGDTRKSASDSPARIRPSRRVTNADDLRDLLKAGGFDAKVAGSRVVTSQKKLTPWTFPLLATLSEDEATVTIILGLATVKDVAKEMTTDRLLQLMKVSQDNATMLFVYNADRKRTEVSLTVQNLNLTGQKLRDDINRMSITAKQNSGMWANDDQQPEVTPSATTPNKRILSATELKGRWSAARSEEEAFGVEFSSDGTFKLVYVNNGRQQKSAGKFTVQADILKLNGSDGLKLEGKLTPNSQTEFRFEAANSTVLIFRKSVQ